MLVVHTTAHVQHHVRDRPQKRFQPHIAIYVAITSITLSRASPFPTRILLAHPLVLQLSHLRTLIRTRTIAPIAIHCREYSTTVTVATDISPHRPPASDGHYPGVLSPSRYTSTKPSCVIVDKGRAWSAAADQWRIRGPSTKLPSAVRYHSTSHKVDFVHRSEGSHLSSPSSRRARLRQRRIASPFNLRNTSQAVPPTGSSSLTPSLHSQQAQPPSPYPSLLTSAYAQHSCPSMTPTHSLCTRQSAPTLPPISINKASNPHLHPCKRAQSDVQQPCVHASRPK